VCSSHHATTTAARHWSIAPPPSLKATQPGQRPCAHSPASRSHPPSAVGPRCSPGPAGRPSSVSAQSRCAQTRHTCSHQRRAGRWHRATGREQTLYVGPGLARGSMRGREDRRLPNNPTATMATRASAGPSQTQVKETGTPAGAAHTPVSIQAGKAGIEQYPSLALWDEFRPP
jgi:hypothetical protein